MNIPPADISIIICSKDRRDSLKKLVDRLRAIPSARTTEIVVVEETGEPASLEGVTYVFHPVAGRGIPFARNLGLQHATGDIVVFIDDDCSIHESWLENLLALFNDGSVVGVQGGVTVADSTNPIGWAESILGFPGGGVQRILSAENHNQQTREVSTLNCAYRKWVLDKIGGFDDRLKFGGEDYVLAKQACRYGKCFFVPDARVTHAARGGLLPVFKWFVRRGRADIDVIRISRQTDRTFFSLFKDAITVKLLIAALLGILMPRFAALVITAFIIGYSTLQYFRYYKVWKRSAAPLSALVGIPTVKLVMDIGMDWGRIRRILFE